MRTHLLSLKMELEVIRVSVHSLSFVGAPAVSEVAVTLGMLRILNFAQGHRGADAHGDSIIWFLCDVLLGYDGCVYKKKNASGKSLVDVIRFLQKCWEHIWSVCLYYTCKVGERLSWIFRVCWPWSCIMQRKAHGEVETINIFYSSECEGRRLKFISLAFHTTPPGNQKEMMKSARKYCRF